MRFSCVALVPPKRRRVPGTPARPEGPGAKVAGGAAEGVRAFVAKKAREKVPDPMPFGFAIKACTRKVNQAEGGAGCLRSRYSRKPGEVLAGSSPGGEPGSINEFRG